jgi:subtilisin family serine protease
VVPSIAGTSWGQASVAGVNLSLRFAADFLSSNYESFLKSRPSVLYVFAAGNDTKDVEQNGLLPASWGGETNGNAITVGAADFDGKYWVRSNWSTLRVDIAAPGCAVPTFAWDGTVGAFKEVPLSGTSVAAPLVSFAGNLLRDLGDTSRIKARILSTGRYFPSLADKVRSSRMLDVPVALALQFDALRDANGRLRLGHVVWPEAGSSLCGRVVRRDEISQISTYDKSASKISVVCAGQRPDREG